jgi:type IV secretion system protein VirB11
MMETLDSPVADPPVADTEATSLELMLRPLRAVLDTPDVTDVHINRPGEAWVEDHRGFRREVCPFATDAWCYAIAKLVANATKQHISAEKPLLSATLPSGERIQIVLRPAAEWHSIALRRPSAQVWSLDELAAQGMLDGCVWVHDHGYEFAGDDDEAGIGELDDIERGLLASLSAGDFASFLRQAVVSRQNILLSGATGSGKTTFGKALIREIPPSERLIVIEDAKELVVDQHPNHVRLFYSQGAQGQSDVSVHTLLVSCLRMRPDRILLAELRKDEAYFYLDAVSSGHPGAITSVHANSARLVFERVISMVREGPGGANLASEDIRRFLTLLVDVVVQFRKDIRPDGTTARRVAEIWYDPLVKRHA